MGRRLYPFIDHHCLRSTQFHEHLRSRTSAHPSSLRCSPQTAPRFFVGAKSPSGRASPPRFVYCDTDHAPTNIICCTVPLLFPARAPTKLPPPFPRRSAPISRSISRTPSIASIYQPPLPAPAVPPAPVYRRTPGRRGEKRPRLAAEEMEEDEKKRKTGRIVPLREAIILSELQSLDDPSLSQPPSPLTDEDTLGTRIANLRRNHEESDGSLVMVGGDGSPTGRWRRDRMILQVANNKAVRWARPC